MVFVPYYDKNELQFGVIRQYYESKTKTKCSKTHRFFLMEKKPEINSLKITKRSKKFNRILNSVFKYVDI